MKKPSTNYHLPSNKQPLRVAIVHDWLYGGGAELVVEQLHQLFPEAPIYTTYCTDEWRKRLDNTVVTGYLQHLGRVRKYLPLLQYWWFKSLNLKQYDLIITSAGNGMAKAIKKPKTAKHVCYCHTPVHYLWRHYDQYLAQPGFGPFNWLARVGLKLLVSPLRKLDFNAAQKVDLFLANSTHIQGDITKYYGQGSVVLFPPIDTARFEELPKGSATPQGFVTTGRLVPLKHTDIIIEACNQLNLPLTVIGGGPELERLKKLAGPTVRVLGRVTDSIIDNTYASAKAFLFASYEDFGIAPVEAMAAGLPVIAYKAGGSLDYVIEHKTGLFFDQPTVDSLKQALQAFNSSEYSPRDIKQHAQRFSNENFQKTLLKYLTHKVN